MIKKLARWITRHTGAVLAAALVLLVPSVIGTVATRVNYDILSYLPEDLDSTQGQQVLEDTFHNAASSMLVIDGMPAKDIVKLQEKIRQVDGVNDAIWVSDVLDIGVPSSILPDEIKNVFYSQTADSTMLLVKYDSAGSSQQTMDAIEGIRSLMNEQCFLSGFSVIVEDTKKLADQEMPLYVVLAVVLSLIAMLLTNESVILPFLFITGIGFAVLYNMGTNIFLGQVSYITKSLAAILQLGVTMDYSIFLIDRYEEECQKFEDHRDAMASAIVSAFTSLSGSSMTTIAGFLALCFMRLTLGRDIGIVMAKGVVLGVLTVVIILPAMILKLDGPIRRWRHRPLLPKFDRLNDFLVRHKGVFTGIFLLMFIPALYAQGHVQMYYNLDESLPDDLPSIVATNKLKEDFNMASTHFVIVDDGVSADQLNKMDKELEKLDGVTAVLAYNKYVGPLIPESFIPENIKEICKTDGKQMMMINSEYRAATDEANDQVDKMTQIVKSYDPNALITGEAALTKDLIEIANHDFTVTNYISILAILLIVGICFKSVAVPIVLVASIELAIYINLGIPYVTGTVIPFISPTVIGCVQLGATVDYAILLSTRFREELRNGKNRETAMKAAANASDRSIVCSALIFFCATFGVCQISKIEMIQSICAMLARGAIISAVVIICILTPLLLTLEKLISKTTPDWTRKHLPGKKPEQIDTSAEALK